MAFASQLETAFEGLRTQLEMVRGCLVLHPSPPAGLAEASEGASARFTTALEEFEAEVRDAAGMKAFETPMSVPGRRASVTIADIKKSARPTLSKRRTNMLQDITTHESKDSIFIRQRPDEEAHSFIRKLRANFTINLEEEDPTDVRWTEVCPAGTLNPHSFLRRAWDWVVMAMIFLDALIIPFELAFLDMQEQGPFRAAWPWILTAFFAVDMLIELRTAYPAPENMPGVRPRTLVTSPRKIAARYIRSQAFRLDVLTTFPWPVIPLQLAAVVTERRMHHVLLNCVAMAQLLRLLRLHKLFDLWSTKEGRIAIPIFLQLSSLIKVFLTMAWICHWNACAWWMIGTPNNLVSGLLPQSSYDYWHKLPHWTTVERKWGTETWRWADTDLSAAYTFCCYWTLGVMRTMPAEVTPVNLLERLYVMMFMFLAFSIFAITLAHTTQAFSKLTERKRSFQEELVTVHMHLDNIQAPKYLKTAVLSFLNHLFEHRRTHAKESGLLALLPSYLQEEVQYAAMGPTLERMKVLNNYAREVTKRLCMLTEVRDLFEGSILSRRGQQAEGAWVLRSGHLEVYDESHADRSSPFYEREAVVLVDEACLEDNCPYYSTETVIAVSCSEVLFVRQEHLFSLVEEVEDMEEMSQRCGCPQAQRRNSSRESPPRRMSSPRIVEDQIEELRPLRNDR